MTSNPDFDGFSSYIMDTYVQYVQSVGARVVPLIQGDTDEINLAKLAKLNGVLFPGGGGGYFDLGETLFNEIKSKNDNNEFYPALGICEGFEYFAQWTATEGKDVLDELYAKGSYTISFDQDPLETQMYSGLGEKALEFEIDPILFNHHDFGVDPAKFLSDEGLASMFDLTATSVNEDGQAFTASMESSSYPFMATQFHPEKVGHLFYDEAGLSHSWTAIQLCQNFVDSFIELARQNTNYYGDFASVNADIIQNYDLVMTNGYDGSCYAFK